MNIKICISYILTIFIILTSGCIMQNEEDKKIIDITIKLKFESDNKNETYNLLIPALVGYKEDFFIKELNNKIQHIDLNETVNGLAYNITSDRNINIELGFRKDTWKSSTLSMVSEITSYNGTYYLYSSVSGNITYYYGYDSDTFSMSYEINTKINSGWQIISAIHESSIE